MKVFHIISHFDIGGAERVALNIASSDNAQIEYHIVEVVRSRSSVARHLVDECHAHGIHVHRFLFPDWQFRYLPQKIAAWLFPLWFVWLYLRHKPAVIHSHTEIPDTAVYAFFRLFHLFGLRARIVRTIHNNVLWNGMHLTGRRVERFMQSREANVVISQSVRQSYASAYGQYVARLIYNGVDSKQSGNTASNEHSDEQISILFAGRFEEQKGIKTLISIIQQADAERYRFTIVGSGRLEQQLREGLADRTNVEIRPAIANLSSRLKEWDYLLMPSEFEGLPLLPIEAAFARVPVLANRAPGLEETLPEDWPLMVDGNNIEQWLHLFRNVLPTANRTSLADSLYRFAQSRFTLHNMQQAYEEIYLSD